MNWFKQLFLKFNLETIIMALEAITAEVQTAVTNLGTVAALKTENDALKAAAAPLQAANDTLTAQLTAATDQATKDAATIADLTAQLKAANDAVPK